MRDSHDTAAEAPTSPALPDDDSERVLTTPEDVASAGRSCMAIIVLGAIILLLVLAWVAYRAVAGP